MTATTLEETTEMRNSTKAVLALCLCAGAMNASAQAYPVKPVHAILSFPPGTGVDIVGRIVFGKVSEMWGQPVVFENRSGAGGSIGANAVARAAADGYTLLVNSNAQVVNPTIYAKLPYDTFKDFVEVAPLTIAPNVYLVSASSPYKTLSDVVQAAKSKPGALNIGHAGIGSSTHLNTERFIDAAKIKVTQVPYKGTPEVITGILGGQVDGYWCPIAAAIPHVQGGKLRPLAVSSEKRVAQLPDVPAVAEAGVKNGESALWVGVWAPAATPRDIVNKVNADLRKAMADTQIRARLFVAGNERLDMSPQQFARYARTEAAVYSRMLNAAGLKPQ
jgi:tripartite-type tricarboxylate transporter receptor subunit TctC